MAGQSRHKRGEDRGVWITAACAFLATLLSGCSASAPKELSGLWSPSPEACKAGLGVTFRGDSVRARFDDDEFVLLASPRYTIEHTPTAALVSIEYSLPTAPGGVSGDLGRGVIDLERTPEGKLTPLRRRFVDLRTGSVRTPLKPGSLDRALALARCPKHHA